MEKDGHKKIGAYFVVTSFSGGKFELNLLKNPKKGTFDF